VRARLIEGPPQRISQFLGGGGTPGRHPHALGDLHEIQYGRRQVEQRLGFRSRLVAIALRANALQLDAQNVIGPVGKDDSGNVEILPRMTPQRRDGVHRRPIGFQTQHRTVRFGDGCAKRYRQRITDRATGKCQPIVGRGAGSGRR